MNRPEPAARVYDRTYKPNLIDPYGYRAHARRRATRRRGTEYVLCFVAGFTFTAAAAIAWLVSGL